MKTTVTMKSDSCTLFTHEDLCALLSEFNLLWLRSSMNGKLDFWEGLLQGDLFKKENGIHCRTNY